MLVIHVSEEYGYREWVWYYPGTVDDLKRDWNARRAPYARARGANQRLGVDRDAKYRGVILEIDTDDFFDKGSAIIAFDATAHFHMDDDTRIKIANERRNWGETF